MNSLRLCGHEDIDEGFLKTRRGTIKRKRTVETETISSKRQMIEDTLDTQFQKQSSLEEQSQPETYHSLDYNKEQCAFNLPESDHTYCNLEDQNIQMSEGDECSCQQALCVKCKRRVIQTIEENENLRNENAKLKESLDSVRKNNSSDNFSIDKIKDSDYLVKLHTGLDNFKVFEWIYDQVKDKVPYMQYYKGPESHDVKRYQVTKCKKPGPERILSAENELLLTLIKLRLNLNSQFLAFMFGVSPRLVTTIISTWLPLLSLELKPLIHWPTREEAERYYPDCFKKYKNVIAITDCTEMPIQRPSLALANGQIYSFYKGRPTCKLLVACTPVGTVSFISHSAGGAMSDKRLVKESGIISKFEPGDTVLADRGFNIQELLLPRQVKLVIPPFLKKKKQFTIEDDTRTKQVANARIHIERVIGRLKDYDILKCEQPLDMVDLFDHIATVVCALINLQEPIIPLNSQ